MELRFYESSRRPDLPRPRIHRPADRDGAESRSILVVLGLLLVGAGVWVYMEAKERPVFHAGDLMTLEEPVVARVIPVDRNAPATSCIVEIYEHLSVVNVHTGTLKARVESNNRSGPSFCPIGADVQIELAWLHRYTLTHRH